MSILHAITAFFDCPFFIIMGGLSTFLILGSFIYTVFLVVNGVIPVWYRLGIGLSKRKIAIFASTEFNSLKRLLVDSKIFKGQNILQINGNSLTKAENESIFLVHWKDFQHKMDEIIRLKKDSTALIVYAPPNEERIDPDMLNKINDHRNSIIVNLRGRLLNDILTCLITTSYELK